MQGWRVVCVLSRREDTMKPSSRWATLLGLVLLLTAGACATRTVYVKESARAPSSVPTMVEVNRGVWVVENYPQPVFYSDNYYWRYDDGVWYRSVTLIDAPVRVQTSYVPVRIRRIEQPGVYVYYRAPAAVARVRVSATATIH